ncbi:MAG: hypothetical protein JWP31_2129, partial [Aeromicrobium sp.]|nr:hypothetical protein [Aeromicrobium sp.]
WPNAIAFDQHLMGHGEGYAYRDRVSEGERP